MENFLENPFVLNRYEDGSTENNPSFLIISRSDFIPPNSKRVYSYFAKLDSPGLYYFKFQSPITDELDSAFDIPNKISIGPLVKYYSYKPPDFPPMFHEDTIYDRENSNRNLLEKTYWIASKYIEIK